MIFDGWCPDCDIRSAVIDTGDSDTIGADTTGSDIAAWAFCTECGAGWIHRDELPEFAGVSPARTDGSRATGTGATGTGATGTAATSTAATSTGATSTGATSIEERRAA